MAAKKGPKYLFSNLFIIGIGKRRHRRLRIIPNWIVEMTVSIIDIRLTEKAREKTTTYSGRSTHAIRWHADDFIMSPAADKVFGSEEAMAS